MSIIMLNNDYAQASAQNVCIKINGNVAAPPAAI
jgi:hypothetical protein